MPWIQLKLNATAENAEMIGELLMDSGALSVTFTDAHDTPIFEPAPGETRLWGDTDITGLYEADTDMQPVLAQLKQSPLLTENFAYKIDLSIWIFLISSALVFFIAILTVSFQSIRAATADPIDSLRYE